MATLKTQQNQADVQAFLQQVDHEQRKKDSLQLLELMQKWTGLTPTMWGPSIVGFGTYHYVYESGREGDWFLTGFSPRKQALTIYIMAGFNRYDELMSKLGTYKTGSSCLYVKRLSDIDLEVLRELVVQSIAYLKERYP